MKKTSIVMILLVLLSILPVNNYANTYNDYQTLWSEKLTYEKGEPVSYGEDNMYSLSYGCDYIFILFTEQREKLTYTVKNQNDNQVDGIRVSWYWDEIESYEKTLVSPELLDIINSCEEIEFESGIIASKSVFRHIVRTLGISYDELKTAFQRMKNEPEYVREIFSYMSDNEFEELSEYIKSLQTPQDFILQAACMEDDDKAESLLVSSGSVYIKERGMIFSSISLLRNSDLTVEEICKFDLTTNSFVKFISDMENTVDKFGDEWKDKKGRTPTEKYALVVSEYEKQLANPKTGEPVYLIPLAAISLTLGVYAVYPRKKRKLEA